MYPNSAVTMYDIANILKRIGIWRAGIKIEDYGVVSISVPSNRKNILEKIIFNAIPVAIDLRISEFNFVIKFWKKYEYRIEESTKFSMGEFIIKL